MPASLTSPAFKITGPLGYSSTAKFVPGHVLGEVLWSLPYVPSSSSPSNSKKDTILSISGSLPLILKSTHASPTKLLSNHLPPGSSSATLPLADVILSGGYPPVTASFEIPYYAASGFLVKYLRVTERSGYAALPWVRYITEVPSNHHNNSVVSSTYAFKMRNGLTDDKKIRPEIDGKKENDSAKIVSEGMAKLSLKKSPNKS